jgi:hypothetical protein
MLIIIIKILTTVLIGQLLGQKEFLSYLGISYIVDIVHYGIIVIKAKGNKSE